MRSHSLEPAKAGGVRCRVCGQHSPDEAEECPGATIYDWNAWPEGLATEKQLAERGLLAYGEVAGVIWYTNRWTYPRGHWLRLFRIAEAQPRPPVSDKALAAQEKARQTALRNRTCGHCGRLAERKIKRADRLCGDCTRRSETIQAARDWLVQAGAVIVDLETTGLVSGHDDVIEICVLDLATGNVLLDTLVAPTRPIVEEVWTEGEDYQGFPTVETTAFGVNGISNAMLVGAPSFADVWCGQLAGLLKGRPGIAYNADFERLMLEGCRRKHNLPHIEGITWQCAMKWYARHYGEWHDYYKDWRWQRLDYACEREHVAQDEVLRHRSLGDCRRIRGLITAVAAKVKPGEVRT